MSTKALIIRCIILGTALAAFAVQRLPAQPVEFDDGSTATPHYYRPWRPGPPQSDVGIAAVGLPFFTAGFSSFSRVLPITFLGGNPSVPGAGTTTIPAVLVPLRVNFLDGSGCHGRVRPGRHYRTVADVCLYQLCARRHKYRNHTIRRRRTAGSILELHHALGSFSRLSCLTRRTGGSRDNQH